MAEIIKHWEIRKEVKMAKYNNIEAERGRLGLSKIAMAERIGMSAKSYYNKVIDGTTDITISEINTIRDVTGKSADYLLAQDEEVIADARFTAVTN